MKTETFMNLIRYHYSGEKSKFNSTLKLISSEFNEEGNNIISNKIEKILNDNSKVVKSSVVRKKLDQQIENCIILPHNLEVEMELLVNSINKHPQSPISVLFFGKPGTGKTEFAKIVAKKVSKKITIMNFNEVISSYLGETTKNMSDFFAGFDFKNEILFLDEIDGLVANRETIRSEEIYRATIEFMKLLDNLGNGEIIIAATNILTSVDKAVQRRFTSIINFDVYGSNDLDKIFLNYFREYNIDQKPQPIKKYMIDHGLFKTPDSIKNFLAKLYKASKFGMLEKFFLNGKKHDESNKDFIYKMEEYGFSSQFIADVLGVSRRTILRWKNEGEKYE